MGSGWGQEGVRRGSGSPPGCKPNNLYGHRIQTTSVDVIAPVRMLTSVVLPAPLIGCDRTCEDVDERGLAGAVGPQEPEALIFGHFEAHAVHRRPLPRELLPHVAHGDGGAVLKVAPLLVYHPPLRLYVLVPGGVFRLRLPNVNPHMVPALPLPATRRKHRPRRLSHALRLLGELGRVHEEDDLSEHQAQHAGEEGPPLMTQQLSSRSAPIRRRKRRYILTVDQSDAGSAGIFSPWRRTGAARPRCCPECRCEPAPHCTRSRRAAPAVQQWRGKRHVKVTLMAHGVTLKSR
eukprot:1176900-Prorocentrum_minimum.AAC.1